MDIREKALSNGVNLYGLPIYMRGDDVCIKWKNAAGYSVTVNKDYKGQHIDLTVIVDRHDKKTRIIYFVGYEKGIHTSSLIKGNIGEIFAPTQPIAITHPHTIPYFLNLEDAYKYAAQSHQKVLFICPICGQTHEMRIGDFVNNGFTCPNKNCQNSWNYKRSGENNPMYGRTGENHPMYGKQRSEETKQKISEAKKGENNPMYGRTSEKNPNWQGGITPIRKHLRAIIEPFMEAHKRSLNYTCELTGKKGNMNGHHIYPFINIVHDAHDKNNIAIKANVCDYTTEELKILEDYVLSWHVIGDWSNMILLAENVHNQFHEEHGKVYDPTLTVEVAYQRMEEFKITWSSVAA